ncbi:MAG: hypothetical protein WAM60_17435 [Candidatus Promineifilaceae bacterium]
MQLELNGRIISNQPGRDTIERAILSMTDVGSILTLSNGRQAFIQAVGSRSNGFIMTGKDSSSQKRYDQLNAVETADVILAFSAFLTGSQEWKRAIPPARTAPQKKPGQMTGKSIFILLIVVFVVVLGIVGFGMFMTARSGGTVASSETTQFVPIVAGIALYLGWLIFLFSWLRPRLGGWLSRALNSQVSENLVSGSWQADQGSALWKRGLIISIEMIVFIPGTFIPLLAVGLLFLR